MKMQFGLMLPQGWRQDLVACADPIAAYETMTRVAKEAEALGFASVWLYDHFHTVPTPTQAITFECWTSTAALARDTRRVRIGQMVTCAGYRPPALLAKMASTVDVLSHGRLTLGLGAGWYEQEYRAYGYTYPDAPTRLRHLRETIEILLAMWTQEEAIFDGKYFQVRGAINQPKGVQQPHVPLLIGGSGEQVTLKLVAQYADACNIVGDVTRIRHKFAVLKEWCERAGREYASIKRTAMVDLCAIGETEAAARASVPSFYQSQIEQMRSRWLIGTPEMIRERVSEYEEAGVQELILYFPDAPRLEALHLFTEACIQEQ
jgi:F420-dependent oxidoreductase-like protein